MRGRRVREASQIQKKINELNVEREKYIAEQRKLEAKTAASDTLGDAVVSTVRKQLAKSGFEKRGGGKITGHGMTWLQVYDVTA